MCHTLMTTIVVKMTSINIISKEETKISQLSFLLNKYNPSLLGLLRATNQPHGDIMTF